jgi:hypothetical protein
MLRFELLALWVLIFLCLYLEVSLNWMFLIIPVWIGIRLWLFFRHDLINQGIISLDDPKDQTPFMEPIIPLTPPTIEEDNPQLSLWKKIRRGVSLVLAIAFFVYACTLTPQGLWLAALAYMIVPMIAIWWGDYLGSNFSELAELIGNEKYDVLVEVLGWLAFCLTPVVVHLCKWRLEFVRR